MTVFIHAFEKLKLSYELHFFNKSLYYTLFIYMLHI
jgi:hypothetical protein